MDLQFIVGRLKEEPFNLAIRAVDFDEKTPDEHLQIINDVFASLDADMKADIRVVPTEDIVEQMVQFLLIHKCQLIPSDEVERVEWIDSFRNRQKATLFPILNWLLSDYENLCKRTYLSQYLLPVDVPSEYLMQNNGNIEDLLEAYKELQAEFVEAHKQYELVTANMDRPTSDIRDGIKQMESEEQQLLDRLQREQMQTSKNSNFQVLFAEASNMRQQQDREIILDDQRREQLQCLATTKQRQNQTRRVLDTIVSCEAKPIESVLREIEYESQNATNHLETNAMQQRHKVELMLLQVEREADKTEDDIEYLVEIAAQTEEMLSRKQDELEKLGAHSHPSNAALNQDVIDEAGKLCTLQAGIGTKTMEKELLLSTNKDLRDSIRALDGDEIQRPDGTRLNRQDFAEFKENVDSSSKASIVAKQEIDMMQCDILELKRIDDSLKCQHEDIRAQFKEKEERAGVTGFQNINEQLEQTSKQTISLNERKSQTLDDISLMVQTIASTLEGKKQALEPKVEELKQRRKYFQELQDKHSCEKERYDEAMTKLMSSNRALESECSRLQEVWLEKERSYHLLRAKDGIASVNAINLSGLGSLKDFYESKSDEQQDLVKKLSAPQQGGEKQSKEYISNQKVMFTNLSKLLELKAQVQ